MIQETKFGAIHKLPPRTKFSPEEDEKLVQLVTSTPTMNWKQISAIMGNRSARQCRERYNNYLAPGINHDPWTKEEDILLLQKFAECGPQWAFMTQFFDRRSCVSLKNHYAKLANQSDAMSASLHDKEYSGKNTEKNSSVNRVKFILPTINNGSSTPNISTISPEIQSDTEINKEITINEKNEGHSDVNSSSEALFELFEFRDDIFSFYEAADSLDYDYFSVI